MDSASKKALMQNKYLSGNGNYHRRSFDVLKGYNETFAINQYSLDYKLKNYNLQDGVIIPNGEERIITSAVEKTTVNMFKAEYTMNEHDVVVLRTNNIEQQLAEKNIPVY